MSDLDKHFTISMQLFKHDELRSRAYRCYYILDFHTFCHCLVQTFLKFGLSYPMSLFLQTFLILGLFILFFLKLFHFSKTFSNNFKSFLLYNSINYNIIVHRAYILDPCIQEFFPHCECTTVQCGKTRNSRPRKFFFVKSIYSKVL